MLARHPGRPEMLLVKRAARRVDGGWWLESDKPGAGAVDSRRFGPVPGPFIEGRVLARYWRPRPGGARTIGPLCTRVLGRTVWGVTPAQSQSGPAGAAGPLSLLLTLTQWLGAGGSSSSPCCR